MKSIIRINLFLLAMIFSFKFSAYNINGLNYSESYEIECNQVCTENDSPSYLENIDKYVDVFNNKRKLDSIGVNYEYYRNILGFEESSSTYDTANTFGYMGMYQFGKKTLKGLRKLDLLHFENEDIEEDNFRKNKTLQEASLLSLTSHNVDILSKYIEGNYVINGVKITKEGMLAAAHLRGPKAVKLYIRSNGRINKKDGYGTSVGDFIKAFS